MRSRKQPPFEEKGRIPRDYNWGLRSFREERPVFVAAKFDAGEPTALKQLIDKGLVIPAVYQKKRLRILRQGNDRIPTHYLVPVRNPLVVAGFHEHLHGRSLNVESDEGATLFKGAGKRAVSHVGVYDRYGTGGLELDDARYIMRIADAFKKAYKRLTNGKHRLTTKVNLAIKHGATFAPIITDPILFKLRQLPMKVARGSEPDFPRAVLFPENKTWRFLSQKRKGILKTRTPGYLPPEMAKKLGVFAYTSRTANRLGGIYDASAQEILRLYGITRKGKAWLHEGKTIPPTEALEKAANGFAARQALNVLIAKEAKALARSMISEGYTIFSEHNTTLAGENVDYDTVALGAKKEDYDYFWALDETTIANNIETFTRALAEKLDMGPRSTVATTSKAVQLFRRIIE